MSNPIESLLQEQRSRQAIYELLCRYCRGLDRMDKAMAYSVWHDDATAHYHDIYEGSGRGFVDWVWQAHAAMERHSHQLSNHLLELSGDSAVAETYVTIVLWTLPDEQGEQCEIIVRGRYLDRFSCQQGRWAIAHREHLVDQHSVFSLCSDQLQRGQVSGAASRSDEDRSYRIFSQLK